MKRVKWKLYMDYEKEEAWLNSMSEKGFAFTDYFLFRYVFEDSEPGEYIYRIELLDNTPGHPESRKYLNFMEENGVEHISSWIRWVYFRKKAADGPFDIYSDIDSKVAHYRRISFLWLVIICMGVLVGVPQLFSIFDEYFVAGRGEVLYRLVPIAVLLGMDLAIFINWIAMRKKMNGLLQEKALRE